jgi:hypothetical protein
MPASHSGANILSIFKDTLEEWNIEQNVMSVTVDNASSNTLFLEELVKPRVNNFFICLERGKNNYACHTRCFAHILNLIAQSGMLIIGMRLDALRHNIRKYKSSQANMELFEQFAAIR